MVGGGIAGVTCAEQVRREPGDAAARDPAAEAPERSLLTLAWSLLPGPPSAALRLSRGRRLRREEARAGARPRPEPCPERGRGLGAGTECSARCPAPLTSQCPRSCRILFLTHEETPAYVSCALNSEGRETS